MIIGLNPSVADEFRDDPTIRRCIAYARDWGYGGLCMVNLFAVIATDPRDLKAAANPVGPRNNGWITRLAADAAVVVAAWGNHGAYMGRSTAIRRRISGLKCLKVNALGEPAHPLYQPKSASPIDFSGTL